MITKPVYCSALDECMSMSYEGQYQEPSTQSASEPPAPKKRNLGTLFNQNERGAIANIIR